MQSTSIKTQLNRLLALSALFALTGCGNDGFKVTTQFDSANGIEVGEPLIYEGQQVGEVISVEEGPNGVDVELSIQDDQVSLFHAKSVVVVNTVDQGTPVELYNRTTLDPIPLVEGQELQGLNSMFELGAWLVGDAIQVGSGTLSDLFESFTGYLEGEQFQADKEQVRAQLSAAAMAASEAVSSVETDISQALSELKVSEGEISSAIEQMGEELSPVVRELSESGSQLIQQLEQFAQNMESDSQSDSQFGEELLQSLQGVFEQLNSELQTAQPETTPEASAEVEDKL